MNENARKSNFRFFCSASVFISAAFFAYTKLKWKQSMEDKWHPVIRQQMMIQMFKQLGIIRNIYIQMQR